MPRHCAWCTEILVREQIHKSDPVRSSLTSHMLENIQGFSLRKQIALPRGLRGILFFWFHFKSSGSLNNCKQAGETRCLENNEKLPKNMSHLGNFSPLIFKQDLVELAAKSSYFNLAGPGGFRANSEGGSSRIWSVPWKKRENHTDTRVLNK